MEKRSWEILYTSYRGAEKKAIELIAGEMGARLSRDAYDYIYHVLPLRRAEEGLSERNAVIVGTYGENPLVRRYVREEEIPKNGYLVKVFDDPERTERKLCVVTAHAPREVYYGATDFVDDYFTQATPRRGQLYFYRELFESPLPDYCHASSPKTETRSIFTWAHPISDYRAYIDNAARLRLNELILWNDYAPVNAREVVDYAHEYGIRVFWGYAWGWTRKCDRAKLNMDALDVLTRQIVDKYEREYADANADGIYFQSFTELQEAYIDGHLVAEIVTDFVNGTASELLAAHPTLCLQFGLHATSVKENLSHLAKTDPRVKILWEDCGAFPYHYNTELVDEESFATALRFTDAVATQRREGACGALYKGQLTMDWSGEHFVHQAGPYLLGVGNAETCERDREVTRPLWRHFQNGWLKNGVYAYRMTQYVQKTYPDFSLGLVGNVAGHVPYSAALCAALLWDSTEPYDQIVRQVQRRRFVEML